MDLKPYQRSDFILEESDRALVTKLHPNFQRALEARGYGNNIKSYEQVASELNVPIGTVKTRVHRARKVLRNLRATIKAGENKNEGGAVS